MAKMHVFLLTVCRGAPSCILSGEPTQLCLLISHRRLRRWNWSSLRLRKRHRLSIRYNQRLEYHIPFLKVH